jgi:hypothetical protein
MDTRRIRFRLISLCELPMLLYSIRVHNAQYHVTWWVPTYLSYTATYDVV